MCGMPCAACSGSRDMPPRVDPRSIEGSPERAADRGREVELGFVASDKPSLGNPDVVRGLVSEFASGVVAARGAWLKGKEADPKARIRELAVEYGNIIMGRDARFEALPWNDPTRLGRRIRLVVPPEAGITDPGVLLFTAVGASLAQIAAAHEGDRLSDAAGEQHTRTLLEDAALLILGLR